MWVLMPMSDLDRAFYPIDPPFFFFFWIRLRPRAVVIGTSAHLAVHQHHAAAQHNHGDDLSTRRESHASNVTMPRVRVQASCAAALAAPSCAAPCLARRRSPPASVQLLFNHFERVASVALHVLLVSEAVLERKSCSALQRHHHIRCCTGAGGCAPARGRSQRLR